MCRWIYDDESRSRTRSRCDDKRCGNLIKVRRFRERRKAKGTEDGEKE
ncbi:CGNR zinc finger domain-containing protein [Paenibacillus tarimensis]